MQDLDDAIAQTKALVEKYPPPDPAMASVLNQLIALKSGAKIGDLSIGRTIAYNLDPAPNAEIQQWADGILDLWHSMKRE